MWIGTLIGSAWAGIPVILDETDGTSALAQVAQRTGLPEAQLDALYLRDLLDQDPSILGQAVLRHCAGAPTRAGGIRTEVARAEAAWRDGNALATMDHLDLAIAQLGCLVEFVEPTIASRMFALRAGLLAEQSERDRAIEELRSALAFEPDLVWNEAFPAEGARLLAEIRGEVDSSQEAPLLHTELVVAPADSTSGPWIDGVDVKDTSGHVTLSLGAHLLQTASVAGITSGWLSLGGPATLVVPTSYRRPILEKMSDPSDRAEVEALIMTSLDDFEAAYAAIQGGLWLITTDDDGLPFTTELVAIPPPPDPEADKGNRWWKRND